MHSAIGQVLTIQLPDTSVNRMPTVSIKSTAIESRERRCSDPHCITICVCLLFSVAEGFMLGTMVSKFDADAIMIAVGICGAVSLGLTLFALQSKWDFTACGGNAICQPQL